MSFSIYNLCISQLVLSVRKKKKKILFQYSNAVSLTNQPPYKKHFLIIFPNVEHWVYLSHAPLGV